MIRAIDDRASGRARRALACRPAVERLGDRVVPSSLAGFNVPRAALVAGLPVTPLVLNVRFPATIPINDSRPALQATLTGTSGTLVGRGIFIGSSPFEENSQFVLRNFTGSLTVTGDIVRQAFSGTDALTLRGTDINAILHVHRGFDPATQLTLQFQSSRPLLVSTSNNSSPTFILHSFLVQGGKLVNIA